MTQTTHPSKQLIRDYMDSRTRLDDRRQLQIRRQLGSFMLPQNGLPDRDGQNEA